MRLFLCAISIVTHVVINMLYTKYPLHFEGEAVEGFEGVRQAFQQNFLDGWEAEGASLAVFVKGEKVVDVWGGYADKHAARTWKQDTISVAFSTTKAVAAVCIAILADRGQLNYDDLVSKHWPGFAKNGKENITIEWVMSHMSGLPYFDTIITEEMAFDHNLMRKVIEEEKPKMAPGTSSGYHTITYGWLVDQIVRHTDEKRRGIGQFLKEEVTEPHGIDFHIGLNLSQEYRVARISLPGIMNSIGEMWSDSRVLARLVRFLTSDKNSAFNRALKNPSWFDVLNKCTLNNPEQHSMEQAAALGIGNARSLANIFNLLVNGHLVSDKMLAFLEKPVINGTDYVAKVNLTKGHGFFYAPLQEEKGSSLIFHTGHGCQQISFDIRNRIVIAYLTNALKLGHFDNCRNYWRIHKAIFDILENSKN